MVCIWLCDVCDTLCMACVQLGVKACAVGVCVVCEYDVCDMLRAWGGTYVTCVYVRPVLWRYL